MEERAFKPVVLAIAGGSCSGKTYLSRLVCEQVGPTRSILLQLDRYYKNRRIESDTQMDLPNFDHPDALDLDLFAQHIDALKQGQSIRAPIYNFETHARQDETDHVEPRPIIILEGHLILHDGALRSHFDLSCYLRCPEQTRLAIRVARDQEQRGRSEASVRQQFERTVAPMHDRYVNPSQEHADLVFEQEDYRRRTADVVDTILRRLESLQDQSAKGLT